MRNAFTVFLLVLFTDVLLPSPRDPADALQQAKGEISNKQFSAAVSTLAPAIESAGTITDLTERGQALGAIHFYTAVAYSGLRDDTNAKKHLQEFFRISPTSNRIDPAKYELRFVKLFNELSQGVAPNDTFETYYPAFRSPTTWEKPILLPEGAWGDSPALEILATPTEKRQWRSLLSSAERGRFIAEFWQRRDTDRQTPQNEFRHTFEQRVAFADAVFGTPDGRGSTSDRGKVLVLLGEPSFVRRRPIIREDTTGHNRVWVPPDTMINGTIEQWVYTREQLPIELSKPSITYRFVTQYGIGVGVLQKENAYAMQALEAAANPTAR